MQCHSNTDGDALILSCVEAVKMMAWKFARHSNGRVEVEDMYSIGMLRVCEVAPRGVQMQNPVAYLCKAAKYAMISEWWRLCRQSTVSLDAPLSTNEGSDGCYLADVVADRCAAAVALSSEQEQALFAALSRLSARQRTAVGLRYGLVGYGASSLEEMARVLQSSTPAAHMAESYGRRKLRTDAGLCAALGVEVAR